MLIVTFWAPFIALAICYALIANAIHTVHAQLYAHHLACTTVINSSTGAVQWTSGKKGELFLHSHNFLKIFFFALDGTLLTSITRETLRLVSGERRVRTYKVSRITN
jgi:hypothetical protein